MVTAYVIYRFFSLVILGGLLLWLFGKFFGRAATLLKEAPGKSFLYGVLYFLLMPFVIILSFITIVGIPVGLLGLMTYIFSFVFAKLVVLVVFYKLILARFAPNLAATWQKWGVFVLLALFLAVISGIDFIAVPFAFGALILTLCANYKKA